MPVPAEWTATALADAVRRRAVTPRELATEALRRIDRYDEGLGAFQLVRRERCLAEADQVDVAVDLPHPRHYTIKTSAEFSMLKARLTEEIRVEAVLAAEAH